MEQVNLQFKFNESEYIEAVKSYLLKKNKIKNDVIIALILIGFGLLSWVLNGYSFFWLLSALIGVVFISIVYAIYFIFPPIRFRKEPMFSEENTLVFDEEGITFKYNNTQSKSKWSDYKEIVESENFFYLVFGKNMYRIIPKRAFNTNEVEIFKSLIKDKIDIKSI